MIDLSDEWFYGQKSKSTNRDNLFWVVIIIFMVSNMAFLTYRTYFQGGGTASGLEILSTELDSIRFQLNSIQIEIEGLKEEIRIGQIPQDTENLILTQLYNRTRRSVVLIRVQTPTGGGTGSGWIYDMEGRIITNNHVVEDAEKIEVTFLDGSIVTAELVGRDPYSDMAVIQVDVSADRLFPVTVGVSSDLLVGESVIAIGNPFGLSNTMTVGIVSAVGRQMDAPGGYTVVDVIQTDAAINPGNSGGPLINLKGEVIGMNTAILSETGQFSGIGFAIPSDTITREIDSLIENGVYEHPWIGISGRVLMPDVAEAMGLDEDTRGTLVIEVSENGPAEDAGFRGGDEQVTIDGILQTIGGDVIIGIDGKTKDTFYDLIFYVVREKSPGDVVVFTIIRDNQQIEIELTLGVRPSP